MNNTRIRKGQPQEPSGSEYFIFAMKGYFSLFRLLLLSLSSCHGEGKVSDVPRFSYETASAFVQRNLVVAAEMRPDSANILKATYYGEKQGGFMIVWFRSNPSKGYIHEKVPLRLWDAWTIAPSKGGYYNATFKGNPLYRFQLSKR